MLILEPIGLDSQIEDFILGTLHPEVDTKKRLIRENGDCPMRINGSRAYSVYINGDDIFYRLRQRSKTWYYYPVQYAKVEIEI